MFNFSSKTKVDRTFKLNELYKLMHADKELKSKCQNIVSVQMTNALSESTTGLKSSSEVNEIYVIKIELSSEVIPYDFIKSLDKTIQFQVLYEIWCENKVKYLTCYKVIDDGKVSLSKILETNWQDYDLQEMPLISSLYELYKLMLTKIANFDFRNNESIKDWLNRISEVEKLQKEFQKTEKLMNSETQPKKKFAYNDKLREIYDMIKELKA